MKEYKLYLFDFDGTLFDSFQSLGYVFKNSFRDIGIEISDDMIPLMSRVPLEESFNKLNAPVDKADYFVDRIDKYLNSPDSIELTRIYPDTLKFLKIAKERKYKLGIVTSNRIRHVYDILDKFQISHDIFDIYVGSDICKDVKPSPTPINMALNLIKYNDDLKDVIYIGDSYNDYQSAINAKITPLLIDRDNKSPNNYKYIKSLMELLDK